MVGEMLRQTRERQKLSVKDIEQGTSIRSVYIEAIENGEYDKLPGEVYTKGFIKNYGNFLKLDGEALSRQYVEETAPPPPIQNDETVQIIEEPVQTTPVAAPQKTTISQKIEDPEFKIKHSNGSDNGSSSGIIITAVVLIAAIAGGLWYYFTNIEGKEIASRTSTINTETQQQPMTTSNTATPVSASTPSDNTPVVSSANGVDLQARFTGRCWTKVVVDGRIAYEGTAEPGQILSWQAADRIIVTAGNAGAVEFVENGQNLGIAGAVGDVIEKTFVRR